MEEFNDCDIWGTWEEEQTQEPIKQDATKNAQDLGALVAKQAQIDENWEVQDGLYSL